MGKEHKVRPLDGSAVRLPRTIAQPAAASSTATASSTCSTSATSGTSNRPSNSATSGRHAHARPVREQGRRPARVHADAPGRVSLALGCVDYVAVNRWPTAVETIRLRPTSSPRGASSARKDTIGHVPRGRRGPQVGGEIAFTDDIVYSSSGLINQYLRVPGRGPRLPRRVRRPGIRRRRARARCGPPST